MRIIQDNLWLCNDCLIAAVNGDFSGLDYSYGAEDAEIKRYQIEAGLEELGPNLVPDFDTEEGEGVLDFSRRTCDCCKTSEAGERHRFAVLGS